MIFISHSTKDKTIAFELQAWLLEKGYDPAQERAGGNCMKVLQMAFG